MSSVKGWVPLDYIDEVSPPPRPRPEDWLYLGEVVSLAGHDDDTSAPGSVLIEGERVVFSRLTEFGGADLAYATADYRITSDMPAGANLCCVENEDWIAESVSDLIDQMRDDRADFGVYRVAFYAWDDQAFVLSGTQFVAVQTS